MSRWCDCYRPLLHAMLTTITGRLLFYTPAATVVRLLTTNFLIAYITSWVLYLSGASEDPRMLLPAWVSIATVRLHQVTSAERNESTYFVVDTDCIISPDPTQDQH